MPGILQPPIQADLLQAFLEKKKSASQNHIAPTQHNIRLLEYFNFPKMLCILRDPRAIMTSWHAHITRKNIPQAAKIRFIAEGLLKPNFYNLSHEEQQEMIIYDNFLKFQQWMLDWINIVQNLKNQNIMLVSYEHFVNDRKKFFLQVGNFFELNDPISDHSRGTHLRIGTIDSYKNELPSRLLNYMNYTLDPKLLSFLYN